jgi:hypothetical protein
MTRMHRNPLGNIIAMDIRADRIGYAAFETPGQLLDYGTSRFDSGGTGFARVEFLFRALAPSVLVLRRPRTRSTRRRPRWMLNLRLIEGEAKKLGIQVMFVAERTLKGHFAALDCRNKFQIAELLGRWFPELARRVPRPRKCYEPEPWAMACFDAIALGAAYFMVMSDDAPSIRRDDGMLSPASK